MENREKLQVGTTGKTIVFTKENFSFAARIMEGPYLAVSQVLSNLKQPARRTDFPCPLQETG